MNTKTLELIFKTADDRTVRITLNDPVEPVDPAAVSSVMDIVLSNNIFVSQGIDWAGKSGARLTDKTVTEIALP